MRKCGFHCVRTNVNSYQELIYFTLLKRNVMFRFFKQITVSNSNILSIYGDYRVNTETFQECVFQMQVSASNDLKHQQLSKAMVCKNIDIGM